MKTTLRQMTPLEYLEFYKITTQTTNESCGFCQSTGWMYQKEGRLVGDFIACQMCGDEDMLGNALAEYESMFDKERELKKEVT